MKRTAVLSVVVCAVFAALLPLCASAQATPSMQSVLANVFALHDYASVGISPRGDALVWSESFRPGGLAHPEMQTELFVDRIGTAPVRLTAGDGKSFYDEAQPVWSPDGKQIAFLSDAKSTGQQQIFLAPVYGSGVTQLTHLTGSVQAMRWSPNGKYIAVLSIAHPHRRSGALAAGARKVGVIGSVTDEQQLAIVNASNGSIRYLTPSGAYVYEYGWAPNSRRLAYTYAYGSGDNNWWIARLAIASIDGAHRDLYRPELQINDPEWSPNGKYIAFISGLMSDFGPVGGDVYLTDAITGKTRDITPGMPMNASSLRWVSSTKLYMIAHHLGSTHLFALATSGAMRALTNAPEAIGSWSLTPGGTSVAMVRTSFMHPAEIWTGTPAALHQITHDNARVPVMYDRARSLVWSSDRFHVQGWLIYPLHYDPHKRYPLVMIVHGGPSSESTPSFDSRNVAALTSHGYFVLEPNPRGSYGQGEAFTRANVKDFGYGDWRDDLAGLDASIASASVDPNKLGLFGWSYGGYMGMWAETQTHRLKAIVAGAGIVNWQSYYGQNDIDQWMIPFFGASVYDDPAVYAKSSPITFIKNSHTPILILQGERDEEVPAPQAFEFYHAMQTLHVPSQLVVYADEGHGPRKPANQIDILDRMEAWFAKYL